MSFDDMLSFCRNGLSIHATGKEDFSVNISEIHP
jgi:hypothetical protein